MAADRIGDLIEQAKGEPEKAHDAYAEAAILARNRGDSRLAYILRHLSERLRPNDPAAALRCAEEARALYSAELNSQPLDRANAARLAALAHEAMAQEREAVAAWREANRFYAEAGVEAGREEAEARLQVLNAF